MNAKQSLKKASARIEELEDFNRRASAEIKYLNRVIDSVIAGEKTYCDWCEEEQECQRQCKGKGCSEWWLKIGLPVQAEEGEDAGESTGILSASPDCGEGT